MRRHVRGGRDRRRAPARSRRMGGTDKLAAEIGGRPLLAWTLDALAAAAGVGRIVVVTSADRLATSLASAVAAAERRRGRRGRRRAPGIGPRGLRRLRPRSTGRDAASSSSTTPRGRWSIPALVDRRGAARPRATGRPSRSCPSPRPSSGSTASLVGATVDRPALGAAQTPAGRPARPAPRALSAASRPTAPRRSPTRPPCWKPVASRSMSSPAIQAISR